MSLFDSAKSSDILSSVKNKFNSINPFKVNETPNNVDANIEEVNLTSDNSKVNEYISIRSKDLQESISLAESTLATYEEQLNTILTLDEAIDTFGIEEYKNTKKFNVTNGYNLLMGNELTISERNEILTKYGWKESDLSKGVDKLYEIALIHDEDYRRKINDINNHLQTIELTKGLTYDEYRVSGIKEELEYNIELLRTFKRTQKEDLAFLEYDALINAKDIDLEKYNYDINMEDIAKNPALGILNEMDPKYRELYNYFNENDPKKIHEYINALTPKMNKYEGHKNAQKRINQLIKDNNGDLTGLYNYVQASGYGFQDGVIDFAEGLGKVFHDNMTAQDYEVMEYLQYLAAHGTNEQNFYSTFQSVGNMTPTIAASILFSVAAPEIATFSFASSGIFANVTGASVLNSALIGLSSYGTTKNQMIYDDIYTKDKIILYAAASATSDAVSEVLLGGIEDIGVNTALKDTADKSFREFALGYIRDMGQEGLEEVIQNTITATMIDTIVLGKQVDIGELTQENIQTFIQSAIVAGILNTHSTVEFTYHKGKTAINAKLTQQMLQDISQGKITMEEAIEQSKKNGIDIVSEIEEKTIQEAKTKEIEETKEKLSDNSQIFHDEETKLENIKEARQENNNTNKTNSEMLSSYLSKIDGIKDKAQELSSQIYSFITGNYDIGTNQSFEETQDNNETISEIVNASDTSLATNPSSVEGLVNGAVALGLIESNNQDAAIEKFSNTTEEGKQYFKNAINNLLHINEKVADAIAHIAKLDQEDSNNLNNNIGGKFVGGLLYDLISGNIGVKRHFTKVTNSPSMVETIQNQGILHFTSEATAKKIMDSGVVKASNLLESDMTKNKSFFFAGTPTFEDLLLNIPAYDVMTAVKIKPTNEQMDNLRYRPLNDRAVTYDGDYKFDSNQAEIVYYGLDYDKESNSIYLKELTSEEAKTYKVSEDVRNAYHYNKGNLIDNIKMNAYGLFAEYKHHQKYLAMREQISKIGLKNVADETLKELGTIASAMVNNAQNRFLKMDIQFFAGDEKINTVEQTQSVNTTEQQIIENINTDISKPEFKQYIELLEKRLDCLNTLRSKWHTLAESFISFYGEERRQEIEEKFNNTLPIAYISPTEMKTKLNEIANKYTTTMVENMFKIIPSEWEQTDLLGLNALDNENSNLAKFSEFYENYKLGVEGREKKYKESGLEAIRSIIPSFTEEEYEELIKTRTIPEKYNNLKNHEKYNLLIFSDLTRGERILQDQLRSLSNITSKIDSNITVENFDTYLDNPKLQSLIKYAELYPILKEKLNAIMQQYQQYQNEVNEFENNKDKCNEEYFAKFVKDNADLLSEEDQKLLVNYTENINNNYDFKRRVDLLFGSNLKATGDTCDIDYFSEKNEDVLNNPEEASYKKEYIIKKRIDYFKQRGLDLGTDYNEYINSEDAKKLWPSFERVAKLKESREALSHASEVAYHSMTEAHKKIRAEIDSLHLLDKHDSFNGELYLRNVGDTFTSPNIVNNGNGFDLFTLIAIETNKINGEVDHNIFHELNHLFETSISEIKDNKYKMLCGWDEIFGEINQDEKTKNNTQEDIRTKRSYELFNEVINELIAQEIYTKALEKDVHIFDNKETAKVKNLTSYEDTLFLVKEFYQDFKNEIIESRSNGNIEAIWNKVGKENFDALNDLFAKFNENFQGYAVYHLRSDLRNNADTENTRIYNDLVKQKDAILERMRNHAKAQESINESLYSPSQTVDEAIDKISNKHGYSKELSEKLKPIYEALVEEFNNPELVFNVLENNKINDVTNVYEFLDSKGYIDEDVKKSLSGVAGLKAALGISFQKPIIKYNQETKTYYVDSVDSTVAINGLDLTKQNIISNLAHELGHAVKSHNGISIDGDILTIRNGFIESKFKLEYKDGKVVDTLISEKGAGLEEGLNTLLEEQIIQKMYDDPKYKATGYNKLKNISNTLLSLLGVNSQVLKDAQTTHDNSKLIEIIGQENFDKLIDITDKQYELSAKIMSTKADQIQQQVAEINQKIDEVLVNIKIASSTYQILNNFVREFNETKSIDTFKRVVSKYAAMDGLEFDSTKIDNTIDQMLSKLSGSDITTLSKSLTLTLKDYPNNKILQSITDKVNDLNQRIVPMNIQSFDENNQSNPDSIENISFVSTFKTDTYNSVLDNPSSLNEIADAYINQYSNPTYDLPLAFKESLDHYVLQQLKTNPDFTKTNYFKNYMIYLHTIYVNRTGKTGYRLEYNTNILFADKEIRNILLSYYNEESRNKILNVIEDNNSRIEYLADKIKSKEKLSQMELDYLGDYLYTRRDLDSDLHKNYVKYIMNEMKNNPQIKSSPEMIAAFISYLPKVFGDGCEDSRVYLTNGYLSNGKILPSDAKDNADYHGMYSWGDSFIAVDKNFLNLSLTSDESLNKSRTMNNHDLYWMCMVIFHELTHQYQTKQMANPEFNSSGLAMIISRLIHDRKDYRNNHDSYEIEIEADENAWRKMFGFILKYTECDTEEDYKVRNEKLEKCKINEKAVYARRTFLTKSNSTQVMNYVTQDIRMICDKLLNDTEYQEYFKDMWHRYPMLQKLFSEDGNINTSVLFEEKLTSNKVGGIDSNITGCEIAEFITTNCYKSLKNHLMMNNLSRDQIINLYQNLYNCYHLDKMFVRELSNVDLNQYDETHHNFDLKNIRSKYLEKFKNVADLVLKERAIATFLKHKYPNMDIDQIFKYKYPIWNYLDMFTFLNNASKNGIKLEEIEAVLTKYESTKDKVLTYLASETRKILSIQEKANATESLSKRSWQNFIDDLDNEIVNTNDISKKEELLSKRSVFKNYQELEKQINEYVRKLGFKDIHDYEENMTYQKAKELGILKPDMMNLSISDEIYKMIDDIAKTKLAEYKKYEEKITSILESVQDENMYLVGQENDMKSYEGVKRKVLDKAIKHEVTNTLTIDSVEKGLQDVHDIIRYTYVLDFDSYTKENITKVFNALEKEGYTVTIKNYWTPGAKCKGINAVIENGDISFEIQFHTEESYLYKSDLTHSNYAFERNGYDGSSEAITLANDARQLQKELEDFIKIPQDTVGWTY